jgi:hypothetical protein
LVTTATPRLSDGEAVLWVGRADSVPWFLPADVLLTVFLLVWTGVAVSGLLAAARKGSGEVVIPVLLVCVGLYLLVGRLFVRHRRWTRAEYTLTSDRLIVANGRHESSDWLDQLPPPELLGNRAVGFGGGFAQQARLAMTGWPRTGSSGGRGPQFPVLVGFRDAAELRDRISQAQVQARRRR